MITIVGTQQNTWAPLTVKKTEVKEGIVVALTHAWNTFNSSEVLIFQMVLHALIPYF